MEGDDDSCAVFRYFAASRSLQTADGRYCRNHHHFTMISGRLIQIKHTEWIMVDMNWLFHLSRKGLG